MQKPLKPGTRCVAVGRMAENRKRIFNTEAFLQDEDETVYARASGRYMTVPADKMDEFRDDFIIGPDCHDIRDIFTA